MMSNAFFSFFFSFITRMKIGGKVSLAASCCTGLKSRHPSWRQLKLTELAVKKFGERVTRVKNEQSKSGFTAWFVRGREQVGFAVGVHIYRICIYVALAKSMEAYYIFKSMKLL